MVAVMTGTESLDAFRLGFNAEVALYFPQTTLRGRRYRGCRAVDAPTNILEFQALDEAQPNDPTFQGRQRAEGRHHCLQSLELSPLIGKGNSLRLLPRRLLAVSQIGHREWCAVGVCADYVIQGHLSRRKSESVYKMPAAPTSCCCENVSATVTL